MAVFRSYLENLPSSKQDCESAFPRLQLLVDDVYGRPLPNFWHFADRMSCIWPRRTVCYIRGSCCKANVHNMLIYEHVMDMAIVRHSKAKSVVNSVVVCRVEWRWLEVMRDSPLFAWLVNMFISVNLQVSILCSSGFE